MSSLILENDESNKFWEFDKILKCDYCNLLMKKPI